MSKEEKEERKEKLKRMVYPKREVYPSLRWEVHLNTKAYLKQEVMSQTPPTPSPDLRTQKADSPRVPPDPDSNAVNR